TLNILCRSNETDLRPKQDMELFRYLVTRQDRKGDVIEFQLGISVFGPHSRVYQFRLNTELIAKHGCQIQTKERPYLRVVRLADVASISVMQVGKVPTYSHTTAYLRKQVAAGEQRNKQYRQKDSFHKKLFSKCVHQISEKHLKNNSGHRHKLTDYYALKHTPNLREGEPRHNKKRPAGSLRLVSLLSVMYCVTYRTEEHTSELQSRENLVCRL